MATSATGILVLWLLGGALLGWAGFPPVWRRRIALAWSLGGLVFLAVALNTEGSRASPTLAVFLMGTHYVTATAQASASVPFYLLSGVCLLLGFAGLAIGDEIASWLARHWLAGATILGLAITALRFALEKTAAPTFLAQLVGVTWLAPVVGAFFFWSSPTEGRGLPALIRSLVLYALAVRGSVFLLMLIATSRRLGSHYDVSPLTLVANPLTGQTHHFVPGSLAQLMGLAAIPQLAIWPLYTVAAGLVGAGVAWALETSWRASNPRGARVATAARPSPASTDEDDKVSAPGRS